MCCLRPVGGWEDTDHSEAQTLCNPWGGGWVLGGREAVPLLRQMEGQEAALTVPCDHGHPLPTVAIPLASAQGAQGLIK